MKLTVEVLASLNEGQREMISPESGKDFPALIIAGPGSGKTHTLAHKVLHNMGEDGLERLLVLTFTRKAAGEIEERVKRYSNGVFLGQSNIGTFHSVFYKTMKKYGFDYTLIQPSEDKSHFMKATQTILKVAGEKEIVGALKDRSINVKPRDILEAVEMAIHKGNVELREIIDYVKSELKVTHSSIGAIITLFFERKEIEKACSFNDILLKLYKSLKDKPEFRAMVSDMFDYIFIDEYQDTNKIQFEIIKMIAKSNVCAIGDPNQSIYAFLSARIENVFDFIDEYEPRVVQLRDNYRSSDNVVAMTNEITNHFQNSIGRKTGMKPLISANKKVENHLVDVVSVRDNDTFVFRQIVEDLKSGMKPSEISVIFRKNSESRKLEQELAKIGVEFNKISGSSFYERFEIKNLVSTLQFMLDETNLTAFREVANSFYGVGEETSDEAIRYSLENKVNITSQTIEAFKLEGKRKKALGTMLNAFEKARSASTYYAFEDLVSELGVISRFLAGLDSDGYLKECEENIEAFKDDISERSFEEGNRAQFLEDIDLMIASKNASSKGGGGVVLTSAHSSKGLEWTKVYMLNISKGNYTESAMDEWKMDDEQIRLLYVAISRAKEGLVMVHKSHTNAGKAFDMDTIIKKIVKNKPSFLKHTDTEKEMYTRQGARAYLTMEEIKTKKEPSKSAVAPVKKSGKALPAKPVKKEKSTQGTLF